MILSVQACTRLQVDAALLSQLHGLLTPGGLLLAVEPEPNPLWDLVFGRSLGWWQGDPRGADASPLRTSENWRRDLVIAGFTGPGSANIASGPWPSTVLWARTPSTVEPVAALPVPRVSIPELREKQIGGIGYPGVCLDTGSPPSP